LFREFRTNSILGNVYPTFGNVYPTFGNVYPTFGNVYPTFGNIYPRFGNVYPRFGNGYPTFGNVYPTFGNVYPRFGNALIFYLLTNYNHIFPDGAYSSRAKCRISHGANLNFFEGFWIDTISALYFSGNIIQ
jgi:hypothetical protein